MLEFSLAALHYPTPIAFSQTVAKTHNDFEFQYTCRDAVLSLAIALNKTIEGTTSQLHYGKKKYHYIFLLTSYRIRQE